MILQTTDDSRVFDMNRNLMEKHDGADDNSRIHPGMFITFEGIDGSGKSTQIQLLAEHFRKKGLSVTETREPGGTPSGEKIRNILLDRNNSISDAAEMLLYAASRAQLVRDVICPALLDGEIVLCDRFLDSSIAYQAYGRGLGSQVEMVNRPAVDGCVPDLTFLLDLPVRTGKIRASETGEPDRLESEKDAFFRRVREGYLAIAEECPSRVKVIDAELSIEEIQTQILSLTEQKWEELSERKAAE